MRYHRLLALCLAILLPISNCALVLPSAVATAPETEELLFTIMHTNDEHSALLPTPLADYDPNGANPSSGGFARLAEAVKDVRVDLGDEPSLLISGGDYLSGSPFSWLALDNQAAELGLMRQLGYDVITLGNHEYDYGPKVLANYLQAAGYPEAADETAIVASNTVIPADHPLHEMGIQHTHIETLANGLRIGFFGLLGVEADEVAPSAPPVTFSEQQAAAKAAVQTLEAADVDLIVAISHSGDEEDPALAAAVSGIDIIISGHTHTALPQPVVVGKTVIVQTGTGLEYLGLLRLAYNPETDQVRVRNTETDQPFLIALDEGVSFDSEYTAKVENYAGDLDDMLSQMTGGRFTSIEQTVLHSDFTVSNAPELTETPFADYATDAMRLIGEQVTGEKVDFAIEANGVIRGSLVPGTLPDHLGQVALLDLVNLLGLGAGPDEKPGYPLVSFYFTGEEVRRVLEVGALLSQLKGDIYFLQYSGLRANYDPERAVLATIPIKNIPIPTGKAVLSAERYTGSGIQTDNDSDYTALKRGDEQLYHVISDYYLAAFLPMVGETLPSWALVMKDKDGNPLQSIDDAIIYRDGQEVKVWQALLEYSASLPSGDSGLPTVPAYYQSTSGRLVQVDTLPIWLWPATAVLAGVTLAVFGIRKWRRHRAAARATDKPINNNQ